MNGKTVRDVWFRGCCRFGSMATEPVHSSRTSDSQFQGFFFFTVPPLYIHVLYAMDETRLICGVVCVDEESEWKDHY